MKKTILGLLLISVLLCLASCTMSYTDVQGTWYRDEGGCKFVARFHDGRYTTDAIVDGETVAHCEGRYLYVGGQAGTLYQYEREECGFTFADTITLNVRLEGRRMKLYDARGSVEYHK